MLEQVLGRSDSRGPSSRDLQHSFQDALSHLWMKSIQFGELDICHRLKRRHINSIFITRKFELFNLHRPKVKFLLVVALLHSPHLIGSIDEMVLCKSAGTLPNMTAKPMR